ncbi:MAG: chorismate synthase [Candidatus Omnitrophota bacterium]
MLRFLTAGESHGKSLIAILEGIPAGLKINKDFIDKELTRRQTGFGRGPRMGIENDKIEILSGLYHGITIASPIALLIKNKDFSIDSLPTITNPRPGHADLAGILKYGFSDIRAVLERASARETAARVGVGAICKTFLGEFKISITSKVIEIGGATVEEVMKKKIEAAIKLKDTLGGIFEVEARNVPCGLGSYVQYDRKLDACIAASFMSIPGIKGVEFGLGFGYAKETGSRSHDAIFHSKQRGYYRNTNNAGGFEGGMTNGENLIIRCCMKPITTLGKPLASVDIKTKKAKLATIQRTDTCAVYAAGVIAEAMLAFELSKAVLDKFGRDSLKKIKNNYLDYKKCYLDLFF